MTWKVDVGLGRDSLGEGRPLGNVCNGTGRAHGAPIHQHASQGGGEGEAAGHGSGLGPPGCGGS